MFSAQVAAACLSFPATASASFQEQPNEEVLSLVVEFLQDADRETRAIGLQQIREELPGQSVTKRLVDLFPKLSTDAQIDLLDALADRGDPAARPLVVTLLADEDPSLRLAALRAAGDLCSAGDVKRLAEMAGQGSERQREAATSALVRLRGEDVNATIASLTAAAAPHVRARLLGVLASRNARDALPLVQQATTDASAQVRLAAVKALRALADKQDLPVMIAVLKKAGSDDERYAAELALLTVCPQADDATTESLIAALTGADVPCQLALLRVLARIGDQAARQQMIALAQDAQPAVRDEAVRMLSNWKDESVVESLLEIARTGDPLNHRVLALRGLVRMAALRTDKPRNIELLKQVWQLSERIDEKRRVLGAVGGLATEDALDFAVQCLQARELSEEAALAVIRIASELEDESKQSRDAAVQQALDAIKSKEIRQRADEILKLK
jgi:HEAT repeat protein